jgi:hypothetical protein
VQQQRQQPLLPLLLLLLLLLLLRPAHYLPHSRCLQLQLLGQQLLCRQPLLLRLQPQLLLRAPAALTAHSCCSRC